MPAYHLTAPGRAGITLVNIGVGPANAKTICDHLAVLRPEAWLMIGHCGGLRPSQAIGDYVLAHAYLRDDHVLDDVLPPEIPVPAIAEVISRRCRRRPRRSPARTATASSRACAPAPWSPPTTATGSCATAAPRCASTRAGRSRSTWKAPPSRRRATASASPTGRCCAFRTSRYTARSSCRGQANRFYEGAISEHLQIGIEAVKLLRAEGPRLHSRKLRAFDEPPFR